jgi:hypothetical protein
VRGRYIHIQRQLVIFQGVVTHFTYPIGNNMKQGCVMSHRRQAKKIKTSWSRRKQSKVGRDVVALGILREFVNLGWSLNRFLSTPY